jgi:hypothetical protein
VLILVTLASVATATSATEVITSTHRIATHQQHNNQSAYSLQQANHHQALLEEQSLTQIHSHYSISSSNHLGATSQNLLRKRKAADGGVQSNKSTHTNSTASSNISSSGAGATSSSSSSIYHQKHSSSNGMKMTAGHNKHGSSQKVIFTQ